MTSDPTFFVDRSLGKLDVADALRASGASVEVHDDHYDQDTLDVVWLPDVASRGWIVLHKDKAIRYNPLEIAALARSGAKVFLFASGNVGGPAMGQAYAKALPAMKRLAERPGPFIAKVYKAGNVKMWLDATKLERYTDPDKAS